MSKFLDLGLGITIINVYYSLTYFLMWCVELQRDHVDDGTANGQEGKKNENSFRHSGLDRCFLFHRQQRTVCLVSRLRGQPSAQHFSLSRPAQERSTGHSHLVLFDTAVVCAQAIGTQARLSSGRARVIVPANQRAAREYVAIGYTFFHNSFVCLFVMASN